MFADFWDMRVAQIWYRDNRKFKIYCLCRPILSTNPPEAIHLRYFSNIYIYISENNPHPGRIQVVQASAGHPDPTHHLYYEELTIKPLTPPPYSRTTYKYLCWDFTPIYYCLRPFQSQLLLFHVWTKRNWVTVSLLNQWGLRSRRSKKKKGIIWGVIIHADGGDPAWTAQLYLIPNLNKLKGGEKYERKPKRGHWSAVYVSGGAVYNFNSLHCTEKPPNGTILTSSWHPLVWRLCQAQRKKHFFAPGTGEQGKDARGLRANGSCPRIRAVSLNQLYAAALLCFITVGSSAHVPRF